MKIYVGNMSFDSSESELRKAFEAHGQVDSVNIITDRDTGRPKGFGFVEMNNDEEAKKAIEAMNGKDFMGRALNVNEARPRTDGPRRGGGGGGGRGFGRSF
ncbi:MAG: RNA-binding protein [Candidatus Krumholzibacteria bacterium]|nr:RNA-binding protein [Candidatus Krumholzibacteria bacterium]